MGERDDQSSVFSGDVTDPLLSGRNWDDQSLSFLGMSGVAGHPVTGETGVTNIRGSGMSAPHYLGGTPVTPGAVGD